MAKRNPESVTKLAVSVPEAARLLGIGRNAAYDAAASGDLPIIRFGKRMLVPRVALDRMLNDAGRKKAS
jgi:excisionase family DNA binding protein